MQFLAWFVLFGFLIHFAVIVGGLLLVMFKPQFTKKAAKVVLYPVKWFISADRYANLQGTMAEKIDNLYLESVRIGRQWKLLLKVIVLTFCQLLFYYLIPYFIMLSLGYTNANVVMIVSLHVMIVMIISLFPIPGGSGGAEFSFESLFHSYITSSSKMVLAMLLWRLITYYFGLIAGAVALVIKPDKVNDPDQ